MYYIAHPITALIVTQVIQRIRAIPHYSIVNWIRPGTVREVVQREATAERLAKETLRLIVDERARERLRRDLGEVKDPRHVPVKRVGEASTTVAQRVAELVLTTAGADASSENQRIAVGS